MSFKKVLLVASIITSLSLAGCGTTSTSSNTANNTSGNNEVVLKAITAWPEKTDANDGFKLLMKEVNDKGKGKVQIKYLGGPEVVPTMELINAVKNGTADIAWLSAGYAVSLVPEANSFKLSNFTADQERKNGLFDLYNEIFQKKANSVYLGWGNPGLNFTLYSNVPIKTLADFKGKPIRVTPAYKDLVTALGASPVTIDPGEVYTALERNVVVGYGWQTTGITDYGWDAKTKYIIDPPFYQTDVIGLVNKDKWNSLNDEQKKIMVNASLEMEKAMQPHWKELAQKERTSLLSKGIQVTTLSPEESKTYLHLSFNSVMNAVLKSSPEYGPKLKELLTKK